MSEGLEKKVRSARITSNKLCATGSRGIAPDWRKRRVGKGREAERRRWGKGKSYLMKGGGTIRGIGGKCAARRGPQPLKARRWDNASAPANLGRQSLKQPKWHYKSNQRVSRFGGTSPKSVKLVRCMCLARPALLYLYLSWFRGHFASFSPRSSCTILILRVLHRRDLL